MRMNVSSTCSSRALGEGEEGEEEEEEEEEEGDIGGHGRMCHQPAAAAGREGEEEGVIPPRLHRYIM